MADITAGLPKLRPEELQAQQDRARIEALGRPALNAALDVGTMIPRAIVGIGNQLIRIPNAFGAGIPAQRLPGDDPNALPSFSLFPASNAPVNTGGATGSWGPALPAMTAPPPGGRNVTGVATEPTAPDQAPVQVATAPRTPKSGRTKTAGGMPAGAPAAPALIPGETGFYMNDQLVPYGTRFLASGDGSVRQIGGPGGGASMMDGLPGGGKIINGHFADPRDALEYGFRLQTQYRDDSIRSILENAGSGAQLGYRARVGALASALGANNFGQVAVGGVNSLNSAIASITSAETGAAATRYSADQGYAGTKLITEQRAEDRLNTPLPIGQSTATDPVSGMSINQTRYGLPEGARKLKPVDASLPKPNYPDGTQVKLRDGRTATMKDGVPIPN